MPVDAGPADPEAAWSVLGGDGRVALEAVELHRVEVGFRRPVRTSRGVHRRRPLVLVRVLGTTDHGEAVEGWGECAALADSAYDPEDAEGAASTLEHVLVPSLLASAATSGGCLPPVAALPALRSGAPEAPLAYAALEMAVADAHLRAAGLPLADLLGIPDRPVLAGAVVGRYEVEEELLARVGDLVAAGYPRVKLKIGPGGDVGPVGAVRRHHPDLLLQVDANESYTEADADRLAALDEFGLLCIEQPFDRRDLGAHARLASRLRTPVCLDEGLSSPAAVATALDLGACSVVCVKPARLGGIAATLATVAACRRRGVPLWIGGMFESAYARGVNAAVAGLPGFAWPGDLGPASDYLDETLVATRRGAPATVGGLVAVEVPRVPGMGPPPDLEAVVRLGRWSVRLAAPDGADRGPPGAADGAV